MPNRQQAIILTNDGWVYRRISTSLGLDELKPAVSPNIASYTVFPMKCTVDCFVVCFVHDDVIKWKHFSRYWPCVRGIHRWPVNSPHKGQWRGPLVFSLICSWINAWVNNREAGDFRCHLAHYDVIVMRSNPEGYGKNRPVPNHNKTLQNVQRVHFIWVVLYIYT